MRTAGSSGQHAGLVALVVLIFVCCLPERPKHLSSQVQADIISLVDVLVLEVCPPGYSSHPPNPHRNKDKPVFKRLLASCGRRCDQEEFCNSFATNLPDSQCRLYTNETTETMGNHSIASEGIHCKKQQLKRHQKQQGLKSQQEREQNQEEELQGPTGQQNDTIKPTTTLSYSTVPQQTTMAEQNATNASTSIGRFSTAGQQQTTIAGALPGHENVQQPNASTQQTTTLMNSTPAGTLQTSAEPAATTQKQSTASQGVITRRPNSSDEQQTLLQSTTLAPTTEQSNQPWASLESEPFNASEVVEQDDAVVQPGEQLRLYAVGASNVLWMTWLDQLHLFLSRLGYETPLVPATAMAQVYPTSVQTCSDSDYFAHLKTTRLGKIGWNSWDFAYDDWSDCDAEGYRNISTVKVKCELGEGCTSGRDSLVRVQDIAKDASLSNVTLVSTWLNDNKQFQTHFQCFNGERIIRQNVSIVIIPTLLRLIRAIHSINPDVWVLIMSKYPPTWGGKVMDETVAWVGELNARIKDVVEQEPRTLFVDYHMPGHGLEMYQTGKAHYGHPNCRGSKLMAQAVLQRLWTAKVLGRTLALEDPRTNVANPNCSRLTGAVCHTSALCWVDQHDGVCKPYSPGSNSFHLHPGLPSWVPGQHKHY